MTFRQASLTISGKTYPLIPEKSNSFDELYVDFRHEEINGGRRWSVFLHPKQDILLQELKLCFDMPMPADARFFANGYQSWSESKLYHLDEAIPGLNWLARKRIGRSGDDLIKGIPRGKGKLHSWTYTYFKKNKSTVLVGSLSERTGFTLLHYDQATSILTVQMDLEALPLSHSFPALDFWIAESTEKDVFDGWFKTMELPLPTAKPLLGWTSWYHYFNNISAEIIEQNLESLAQSNLPMQCFQIDDGWQSAVGDWFSVKPAFPGGMTEMARKISEKGYSPGLWLAPFVASAGSELVKKHPDWLLKDERGRALKAGWNPMWGGHYYALDFYNNAVRDYLSGVFHTVLDKWGYQLLKLDFLFAVCLAPPKGKTRGAVMWEAMEFLRRLVGHRQILACGVPLGACIGQVEYCRIGGDIHMAWEHKLLKWLNHRERVSSIASLRSTLGRWQLNGRAFQNDPDVFVLRKNKQQLSPNQQFTILVINALLGNVLLTSDNVADYGPEQYAILEAVPEWRGSQVLAVKKLQEDVYNIAFKHDGTHWAALCNLTKNKVVLADDQELLPYQTVVVAQDNY